MRDIKNIIGHAKHVMRALGKGHRENVYGKALQTSFHKAFIPFRAEVCCPIIFMDEIIGYGRADFVVGDFVIEIKANRNKAEEASDQLEKYLRSLSKIEKKEYTGLILNFNQSSGQVDVMQQVPYRPKKVTSRFFIKNKK
jgi:GxxExxY protein